MLTKGVRVVIIQRKGSRELNNHKQLVEALKKVNGVSRVDIFAVTAANPTPWAFWKNWSQADIVVGPHGAGFANMIAMPPWGHVVEVLAHKAPNFMYAGVALRLGLRYHSIIAHDMKHTSKGTPDVNEVTAAVHQAAQEIRELQLTLGSKQVVALCERR